MTAEGQIVIPALALRTSDGVKLDVAATARYARRAASTWADEFILSRSTTRGDLLTVGERTELLDLWSRVVPVSRLVACCWCQDDVHEATRRAITPMVVMHSLRDDQALSFLEGLPHGAYVYSHPKYDSRVCNAALAAAARQRASFRPGPSFPRSRRAALPLSVARPAPRGRSGTARLDTSRPASWRAPRASWLVS